ncbi:MAG: STAS/SEC14 domain-containing protein [Mariprofundaceae bacterium]
MITATLSPDRRYCLVEPSGPLAATDFANIAELVDPVIEANGQIDGLVIHTMAFPGWVDFAGLISHIRFIQGHHAHIGKVALVTDSAIADLLPKMADHFVRAEIRHFPYGQLDAAERWVAGN